MKKLLFIPAFLAISLFAEDVAIVKMVEGTPKAKRDNEMIELKVGDKLLDDDIVVTDSASKIGVIFNDGSSLTLGELSYLSIEDFKFEPIEDIFEFKLELSKGKAVFESGKIGELAPDSFEFKIPKGVIGIRGTKFLIEIK